MSVTIPDYQTLMLPVLRLAAEGEIPTREAVERMADAFSLSDAERNELLPSGRQTVIANRTHWAVTYLVAGGLLHRPRRGVFTITGRGREVLARNPARIDVGFLRQFPEFRGFLSRSARKIAGGTQPAAGGGEPATTPEESINTAAVELRAALADELLQRLRTLPPAAFEQLVVELLLAMGYGARGRGVRVGRSGDGGIDGMVDEDALGLDTVYLQAKRYGEGNSVGREQLQAFAGALLGHGVHKGVFVTTGRFTREARAWAESQRDRRIVLIDGERLAELMIDHGVGVRTQRTVEIRSLDEDWFEGLGG